MFELIWAAVMVVLAAVLCSLIWAAVMLSERPTRRRYRDRSC